MPNLNTFLNFLSSYLHVAYFAIPISVSLLFLGYKLLLWRRYRLPPGPRPLPIVGNLYDIGPVRCKCFWEWSMKYGSIMSVWMGPTLNVVISEASLAKEVLKDKDQQFAARNRTRAADLFSKNGQDLIWADYGPHYVKVRKVCTLELFTPKRLEALRPLREEEVGSMILSLFKDCGGKGCDGKTITLRNYLAGVSFNNITRIVFGKKFMDEEGKMDPQGMEFKDIIAQGMRLGASLKMAEHVPYIRWMFPFHTEDFIKHGRRRDKLTKLIMQEHTLAREKSGGAKQHFVDGLLTLQDQYDLSETNIIGLLWDMITAGMDTTAISVEWAMAELVRNPRVQQKTQEELDRVIGIERVIHETDFAKLPYLQCVVKESLRLHPPTPLMLPHKAIEDVKVGGYDIPKGSV
eukprot:c20901_g1_i1 orf=1-1212(-)